MEASGIERKCEIWYIKHVNGHIVTAQSRAWNDTARMLMYVELVLGPMSDGAESIVGGLTTRKGGNASERPKHFLWMDNFSVHNSDDVRKELKRRQVEAGFYPPNMTGELQVLDVVVNKNLKQLIRRLRERELVTHFHEFKKSLIENNSKLTKQELLQVNNDTI